MIPQSHTQRNMSIAYSVELPFVGAERPQFKSFSSQLSLIIEQKLNTFEQTFNAAVASAVLKEYECVTIQLKIPENPTIPIHSYVENSLIWNSKLSSIGAENPLIWNISATVQFVENLRFALSRLTCLQKIDICNIEINDEFRERFNALPDAFQQSSVGKTLTLFVLSLSEFNNHDL